MMQTELRLDRSVCSEALFCGQVTLSDTNRSLQAHPDVPVVENLEDLWMVSKLQRERKAREAAAKAASLARMRVRHSESDWVPTSPDSHSNLRILAFAQDVVGFYALRTEEDSCGARLCR